MEAKTTVTAVIAFIALSTLPALAQDKKWVWNNRRSEAGYIAHQSRPQARYEIEEYPEGNPVRPPGAGGFGLGGRPGYNQGFNPGYRPGVGPGVGPGIIPGIGPGIGPGGPGGPGFGSGIRPDIGVGVRPGSFNPGFGGQRPIEGGYGNGGGGILTGPVPSWEREPPIKHFDRCKCTEKFNCNSPGISYGHCDVGKSYCCYNSGKNPYAGSPLPARPVHSIENGVLVGPGGPLDPVPGGGQLPPAGFRPYPQPGPYDLGNGVLFGPGGNPGRPGYPGSFGSRPVNPGFRPDGGPFRPGSYNQNGYGQGRPPYNTFGRSNKPKNAQEDEEVSSDSVESKS